MHGQSAPVQGQTGPSWQDGADVWILTPTVVRFLSFVQSERKKIFLVTRGALLPAHLSHSLQDERARVSHAHAPLGFGPVLSP
jgi:hypothetical protein